MIIIIVISLLLIIFSISNCYYINNNYNYLRFCNIYMSKGFGSKTQNTQNNNGPAVEPIKLTRKTDTRQVMGNFAKVLAKQSEIYDNLYKEHENNNHIDVYCRLSISDTFYFVGKVNYIPTLTAINALLAQKNLIIEYSKSLRPKDLAGPNGMLGDIEIWYAPGNSEMNVAQNKIKLEGPLLGNEEDMLGIVKQKEIGYSPEIYQNGEIGFRVQRDNLGNPIKSAFEVQFQNEAPK